MSGTGNSYRTACWVKDRLSQRGFAAEIIPLEPCTGKLRRVGLLVLIFPTHAFTAPWPVLKFIAKLPRQDGTEALIIACRAGWTIGPWLMPGLEGTAGYLAALLLRMKGCRVRGVMGLDMPANWTAAHWGLNAGHVQSIITAARAKTEAFTDAILAREFRFRGMLPLFAGLLLVPISFIYLALGRFYLAKIFFASLRCTGCGLCARTCPHGGIVMRGKRPFWTLRCESCMRCMNYCPEQAIECSHPLIVLLHYATAFPAAAYALGLFGLRNANGLCLIVQYCYALLTLCLVYRIFHSIVGVSAINRLFFFTTMTPLFRRYHEPTTCIEDLTANVASHRFDPSFRGANPT